MKLKKVSAQNLKGGSFEYTLGAATLFVGSNFNGKSARGDALRLALLGYLPELGKTSAATFGLCSGRELIVEAEFEDGSTIFRRWWAVGNSVKSEESLPTWLKDDNEEIVAVMLNADVYFRLTETARVNYIFDNVQLGGGDKIEPIMEEFSRELFGTEGLDGKAAEVLIDRVTAERNGVAETPLGDELRTAMTPQTFLEALGEFVDGLAKSGKAAVSVYEKTVQGLTQIRTAESGRTIEVEIAALTASKNSIAAELATLREEKGKLTTHQEHSRADRGRRDVLTRAIAAGHELEARRTAKAAEASTLSQAAEAIVISSDDEFAALEQEVRETEFSLRDFRREADEFATALAAREKDAADLMSAKLCPFCGACGTDWRDRRREELVTVIEKLAADKERTALRLVEVQSKLTRLTSATVRARNARGLKAGKLRELETVRGALASIERALSATEDLRRQLATLSEPRDYAAEVDAVALKIAGKAGELNEIEVRLRAHDGRKHDLVRLAQAEEERDRGIKVHAVASAAVKIVKEIKARTVAAAFAPILETANAMFPDLLRGKLALVDGEIGWHRPGGVWVGHKTFSGAEKALAYAAIQTALASRAPVRIIFIDELGKLDDVNAVRFIADVALAIERGDLGQFVGIDTGRALLYDGKKPDGFDLSLVVVQESALDRFEEEAR